MKKEDNQIEQNDKKFSLRENISLILAAIALLAFIAQAFSIPSRVERLENQVSILEKENKEFKICITEIQSSLKSMEPKINSLYDHFLEKGLKDKQ